MDDTCQQVRAYLRRFSRDTHASSARPSSRQPCSTASPPSPPPPDLASPPGSLSHQDVWVALMSDQITAHVIQTATSCHMMGHQLPDFASDFIGVPSRRRGPSLLVIKFFIAGPSGVARIRSRRGQAPRPRRSIRRSITTHRRSIGYICSQCYILSSDRQQRATSAACRPNSPDWQPRGAVGHPVIATMQLRPWAPSVGSARRLAEVTVALFVAALSMTGSSVLVDGARKLSSQDCSAGPCDSSSGNWRQCWPGTGRPLQEHRQRRLLRLCDTVYQDLLGRDVRLLC